MWNGLLSKAQMRCGEQHGFPSSKSGKPSKSSCIRSDSARLEISGADSSGLTEAMPRFQAAMMFGPSKQHVLLWALFIGLAVCQREMVRDLKPEIFMKTAPEARNELAQTGRSGCDAIGY
jgi:hypothetical protein